MPMHVHHTTVVLPSTALTASARQPTGEPAIGPKGMIGLNNDCALPSVWCTTRLRPRACSTKHIILKTRTPSQPPTSRQSTSFTQNSQLKHNQNTPQTRTDNLPDQNPRSPQPPPSAIQHQNNKQKSTHILMSQPRDRKPTARLRSKFKWR